MLTADKSPKSIKTLTTKMLSDGDFRSDDKMSESHSDEHMDKIIE